MELRLQYILHNLGSNTSNKSLVQLNSNAWKQYPPLPRHLWALHENTYTKGKHIRKVICTITGALGKQMCPLVEKPRGKYLSAQQFPFCSSK